jgi:hypothetical protein
MRSLFWYIREPDDRHDSSSIASMTNPLLKPSRQAVDFPDWLGIRSNSGSVEGAAHREKLR